MAATFVSTVELLQLADGNISDIQVSDLLDDAPLVRELSAIPASNATSHEWLKKTAAPNVGFRAINNGRDNSKAGYTKVTQALKLFDASFDIDMGLLKANAGDRLMRREAIDHLRAAFADYEKQIIYGTGSDAAGFAGLAQEARTLYKDSPMVVDATGTTVGGTTSVWAIRAGESDVSAVYGGDGQIEIGEAYPTLREGSADGHYDAMRTPILFFAGLQVATAWSIGRICNLTAQANKTLTDLLISSLLAKFPAGRPPTHLVMNRQSHMQLQQSRTATNPTGAPAPFPTEAFGIPIVVTDQITNAEAVVIATP